MPTVAVVQAAPVLFDGDASVSKAVGLARDAAAQGATLVLFPEAFIPAYPRGLSFGAVVGSRTAEGRAMYARYVANSIDVPGPGTATLAAAARDLRITLAIGVIERDPAGGTLYCTLLVFGPDGSLLHHHRKLKPTASERLVWGEGDGRSLRAVDTPAGKVGGLICWENYMPLARAALYQQGVRVWLAPTADAREVWQSTMRHIALEGRCYVLGANQFVTRDMYPEDLGPAAAAELAAAPEIMCRGGSVIVDPLGAVIAGPLWDREGILVADLDLDAIAGAKMDFDPVGHYARPDVLTLRGKGTKPNALPTSARDLHRNPDRASRNAARRGRKAGRA
ncbi:MAG: carbon-nitrogen hydrolase family protein [Chloroflexota bacterium]